MDATPEGDAYVPRLTEAEQKAKRKADKKVQKKAAREKANRQRQMGARSRR